MGVIISNILAIYRKELQGYFASPLAYIVAGAFWFLAGLFFITALQAESDRALDIYFQGQQVGAPVPPIDVAYNTLQSFLGAMFFLSLFILPILSMGLYSEERKRGTLELLATSPVTNWAVAVGKWLGVLTFFITMVVPLLAYEAIAFNASSPPLPPAVPLLGHAALILVAAAILSLGMFISSLTESTILAAILTFVLILCFSLIELLAKLTGGVLGEAWNHLSLVKHYNTLVQGVVDTSSLIMFASYIILGVFLTAQSIDALRYQRS
jgi:ABC-2 type transport system permease protein